MELFEDIFIDIGDKRLFDNDLSTYSLHLLDMKLRHAADRVRYFHRRVRSGDRTDIGGVVALFVGESVKCGLRGIFLCCQYHSNYDTETFDCRIGFYA